jgi:hypothetical protein
MIDFIHIIYIFWRLISTRNYSSIVLKLGKLRANPA